MQSGTDERSVPGNTVAVQADMPFSGLTTFGTAFLSKFECSQMPHPVSHCFGLQLLWSYLFNVSKTKTSFFYTKSCWSTLHL